MHQVPPTRLPRRLSLEFSFETSPLRPSLSFYDLSFSKPRSRPPSLTCSLARFHFRVSRSLLRSLFFSGLPRGSQIHSRFAPPRERRLLPSVSLRRFVYFILSYSLVTLTVMILFAASTPPLSLSLSFSPFSILLHPPPLLPYFEALIYSRSRSNLLANFHFYL